MQTSFICQLPNEAATERLGATLATFCKPGWIIYLQGDLGAGKTTLARALLHALGHVGKVKSPTYTLIEPYNLPSLMAYHLDLYRLGDPDELEYIGLRDLLDATVLLLVEWPEHGHGYLPPANVIVELNYQANGRNAKLLVTSNDALSLTEKLLEKQLQF